MYNHCSILQACEWIAFKYYPNGDRSNDEYVKYYVNQSDEYKLEIDEALKKLKRILLRFDSNKDYIKGVYYKSSDEILTSVSLEKDYTLDLKINGIIIDGKHEINVILFEGDDESKKYYAPTYTNIQIDFTELKKAKYFKHIEANKDINPKKRGPKPKVNDQEFEKYFNENMNEFEKGPQEAWYETVSEKFPNIGRTTIINKIKSCKEKKSQNLNSE